MAKKNMMKGIDVTVPPCLPRYFAVRKGCMGDIYVGSDSDTDSENELNTGMFGDGDGDSDKENKR